MDLAPAVKLIKEFEGCLLTAYLDSVNVPTIGYGHTADVHMGMHITQEQADLFLKQDIEVVIKPIIEMVKVPLKNVQLCALVSFCFNLGVGSLKHSHLLTYLNAGRYQDAADQILRWDHAGGKRLAGLTRRRHAERDLFLSKGLA